MTARFNADRPLRWGILGCGNVTERKSGPAFNKAEGSRLVAVMRRDAAKAQDYAKRHGVPRWYFDADALIQDAEVDAVYIATPPGSHYELALRVAQAGKHCYVEKPMALDAVQCMNMVMAFEAAERALFVAYYRRSLPRFNQVKQWIDAGLIGTVRHLHWSFARPPSAQDERREYNWRTDPAVAGGGYFMDLACHGLDLMMHLLGRRISQVEGMASNQQGLYSAEDTVAGSWLFEGGASGTGFWNFGCHERQDEVLIRGSRGKITFSVFDEVPLRLHAADGSHQSLEIPHPENIQFFHIQNIVKHLNGEMIHPALGQDGLQASWVMDRLLSSFRRGAQ